jgi:hypothetical protein
VQLLVTMKKCQPRIVRDEVQGEFLKAACITTSLTTPVAPYRQSRERETMPVQV